MLKYTVLLLVGSLFWVGAIHAQKDGQKNKSLLENSGLDNSPYSKILQTYVNNQGQVDYAGLQGKGRAELNHYVNQLSQVNPSQFSADAKKAFYINAYNAFTLKLVVDHYPLNSIRKIPKLSGVLGKGQWNKELWLINQQKISLDAIEHKILRPMGDPRVHFALVCASISCPNLSRKAYHGKNVNRLLDEQAQIFNQSEKGLRLDVSGTKPTLYLSSIYQWFKGDFLNVSPSLIDFILPHVSAPHRQLLEKNRGRIRIKYLDYDWGLNRQP